MHGIFGLGGATWGGIVPALAPLRLWRQTRLDPAQSGFSGRCAGECLLIILRHEMGGLLHFGLGRVDLLMKTSARSPSLSVCS